MRRTEIFVFFQALQNRNPHYPDTDRADKLIGNCSSAPSAGQYCRVPVPSLRVPEDFAYVD